MSCIDPCVVAVGSGNLEVCMSKTKCGFFVGDCVCVWQELVAILLGNSKAIYIAMYYSFVGCTLDRKMLKGKWSMEVKGTNSCHTHTNTIMCS